MRPQSKKKKIRGDPQRDKILAQSTRQLVELYKLSETIIGSSDLNKVYKVALSTIKKLLKVDKTAILLFDNEGILKFKSWIGISKRYRQALKDHSHWEKDNKDALPFFVSDVALDSSLTPLRKILESENVRSFGFFPLFLKNNLIGKFVIYYKSPHIFSKEEVEFAQLVGKYVSFVINRKKVSEDFLNGIGEGITIQDSSGHLIYVNHAAALASGYKSPEEMLKNPAKWLSNFELRDEKGLPFKLENLPGRRALESKGDAEEIIQFKNLKTGDLKWSIVKARPSFDQQGEIQFVTNLIQDITERMELERRKDEFISTASHELKTPIATLKGFTQILETMPHNSDTKYYLSKINSQIDRLSKLVDDLLDVSRIHAGKLSPQKKSFNIVKLVSQTAEDMQLITDNHKIIVKNGVPEKYIYGDKYQINEVIYNLLSNAIKFSPQADKVVLNITQNHKNLVISVRDFGIGISKKNLERVFEPFFQASSKIRQSFSGLGLGLYISSEIIKQHQGKMWVDSEKSKGSTFYFSLPLRKKKL